MNSEDLKAKIAVLSQFPHKERKQPYQSYWIGDEYVKGSRDTVYRFDKMGIPPDLTGLSVLDLGSQLGAMSGEAYRRGATNILGLEYEKDFVNCARELAEFNQMKITFKQVNLKDTLNTLQNINGYFNKPVDMVFALSLTKHIGTKELRDILRGFRWKVCYLESHNCNGDLNTPHCQTIKNDILKFFPHTFLGFTEDRSIRAIWKLIQSQPSN